MNIKSYTIESRPIMGICKSPSIWGLEGSVTAPLVYLRKPKWMSDESFNEIIKNIRIDLPMNFEAKRKCDN